MRILRLQKKWGKFKQYLTIPNFIVTLGIISAIIYIFSFLFPLTDNAFVVNNVRPVAAQVEGFITHLYVKNGQYVKKGQILFTVFKKKYQYKVDKLSADLEAATSQLEVLKNAQDRHRTIRESLYNKYIKLEQDDKKYQQGYQIKAVSLITLQNSRQDTLVAKYNWEAACKQLEIDHHRILEQEKHIKSIQSSLDIAKVNLDFTNVHSDVNGVIQNLFIAVGSPIKINKPVFSLVDTDDIYIQANFNETDLRDVSTGSKAYIFPRRYLGKKMFHGIVQSNYWSANRQNTDTRTQLQTVMNENEWILLPQRLPVIIKIIDPDPNFPLSVGSSAYVYIKA
jgi:multidrug resistance efflux pump